MSAGKKIKTNIQNSTLNSSFDALSKWHDPDISKENELRSRVFSEKMGLESGWNCHISLKSNDGMTSMRKTVSYHCPSRPGYLPGRKKSGKRAAVAARNIKLIGMYIIIKKRVGTKKNQYAFQKVGVGLVKPRRALEWREHSILTLTT